MTYGLSNDFAWQNLDDRATNGQKLLYDGGNTVQY